MDSFGVVRALAREKHDHLRAKSLNGSSSALLAAARENTGIKTQQLPRSLPLLAGGDGALHRKSKAIYIANDLADDMAAFVEAHEFGHYWIETPSDPATIPAGSDPGLPERGTPLGLNRVEAYSAQELRERHANVFGREFLLPRFEARRLFVEAGLTAPAIARDLKVPLSLVHQQLAAALLLPEAPSTPAEVAARAESPGLDSSQKAAAEHAGSPLLVEAGPGTGKTRTLVARVEHLLQNGASPSSILALTFSNKAAQEIRERVALTMPAAATEIWAGTFHAFGLEILRKFGHLADVEEPVRLLDQSDQMALLEAELPELGLDHYLRLHEPLSELRYILSAISRVKDDVKSSDEYAEAADRMLHAATNDEDLVKAEKAVEVAHVYRRYERLMRDRKQVDFADLVSRPLEIFKTRPDVLETLRAQYQHLLVDEYQDVNRASALLVKALAGDGERLWVVGDARQSIYRFRGAAPVNTRNFEADYPAGKRKPLAVNYRSHKEIVDAFGGYAATMRVGSGRRLDLDARRGASPGVIDFNVAVDRDAEIAGIAAQIRRFREDGIAFRDQAVLCRTHTDLENVAAGLEAAGVPILYLGDLFERPEVSDLLALISFVAEPGRGGLYRVAALPPYRAPLADVKKFLENAKSAGKTPHQALSIADAMNGVSDAGRAGLMKLAADLHGVGYKTGPGSMLCRVLFDRRELLASYLDGNEPLHQQRRLAIHQLLQFAIENDRVACEGDPKRHMLDWIRRLECFGDERSLRDPPAAIDGIDAVRLMTVHASKGLEFKAVHLPCLGKGKFPNRWQGNRCPAPPGLLDVDPKADHEEEEECLFFVAMSRARDRLSLSRAERYSKKQGSNSSEALLGIAAHLPPGGPNSRPTWTAKPNFAREDEERPDLSVAKLAHDGRDIDAYIRCSRRYLYQQVLGLSGGRDDNAYVQFHRAVYGVLKWIGEQPEAPSFAEVEAVLDRRWKEIGPAEHLLEHLYLASANRILRQAAERPRTDTAFGDELAMTLDGHTLTIPIDEIDRSSGRVILRRLRTGRPPSKHDQSALHALMLQAGRQSLGASARFEVHYLTTNEAVHIPLDGVMNNRMDAIRDVLASLKAGRFPADPENYDDCPRCPHYFICPSVPK